MAKKQFEWLMIMSQLLAQLSDRMTSLGLIWFITTQYGEGWLTWYLVVGGLPHLLLAGFSGRWIQKIGALRTIVLSDFWRAILFGVSAYFFSETPSTTSLYLIISIIFTANIFSAFFNPAILTLPIELEEEDQIQRLTARLTTITSLTTMIGPIFGLICFNRFGIKGLFFTSFLSYLISGGCAFQLTKFFKSSEKEKNKISSKTISLKPVSLMASLRKNKLIATMLWVFLFMNLFLSPLQVLLPVMAKNIFNNSFNSLAYMEVVFGTGIVLGGILLSLFTIKKKELLWVWGLLLFFSSSYVLFNFQDKLILNLFFLLMMGVSLGLVNVLIIHLFQERPLPEDVPNVMSLTNLISTASVPFSLTMLAFLQTYIRVEKLGILSSVGLMVMVLLAYFPFQKWGKDVFK